MKKRIFLSAMCACLFGMTQATNYYAAPGAKGDGKSISNPGDLNNLAAKTIAGGDSLFLTDGVYYITATVDVKTAAGTADKRTFVGAMKGAHPIIDGSKMSYGG